MKREDGYYWEMNELDVEELSSVMEDLAQQWPNVEWSATDIKQVAHKPLNWEENGKGLVPLVDSARKTKLSGETSEALDKMIEKQAPQFTAKQRIHQALITLGARKIKRALLGRG